MERMSTKAELKSYFEQVLREGARKIQSQIASGTLTREAGQVEYDALRRQCQEEYKSASARLPKTQDASADVAIVSPGADIRVGSASREVMPPPPPYSTSSPRGDSTAVHLEVPRKKSAGVLMICAAASLLLVWMVVASDLPLLARGLAIVCLPLVGYATVLVTKRLAAGPFVSMSMDREALTLRDVWGPTRVPWRDVESIGVSNFGGQKLVGLRLSSYEQYIASMSGARLTKLQTALRLCVLLGGMILILGVLDFSMEVHQSIREDGWLGLGTVREAGEDAAEGLGVGGMILGIGLMLRRKASMAASTLQWLRDKVGFDIVIGWADLPGPAASVAEQLNQYRSSLALSEP